MIASIKKIIVCLDHTLDQELIENTGELIKLLAGPVEILFLNIIKDFNLPEVMQKEFPDIMDKAIKDRETKLGKLVKDHGKFGNKTTVLIRQGNETKEILKVVDDSQADLIILGSKTNDSVLNTRIARRSPCNLLLIPKGSKIKFDKVFIPVDFSEYSLLSLEVVLRLTQSHKTKIYLQNVVNVPSSYRYSGKSYEEFAEILKGHANKYLKALIKKATPKLQELIPVFTIDKKEHVTRLIMREALKEKVDMIVVGAKGRTIASALFIGSKSERMVRINNEIPMMIIRKKGAVASIMETIKKTLE